tara:strand:+ start:272 stop:730 length:459 start_codon:yes stop_codon:yes gene_type:complete
MENLKKDSLIYAIDQLEDLKDSLIGNYASDLHHYLFNENYYIIGHYKARQWLGDDFVTAVMFVQGWEMENLGESQIQMHWDDFNGWTQEDPDCTSYHDSEGIANKLNYIFGLEILGESKIFNCISNSNLYERLSSFTLDLIIRELRLKLNYA